jgi:hypothetical protein
MNAQPLNWFGITPIAIWAVLFWWTVSLTRRFPSVWAWLLANVAGIGVFLWVGSTLWRTGCDPGPGDWVVFFLLMAPILAVFAIAHIWGFIRSAGATISVGRFIKFWMGATLAAWAIAVWYDRFKVLDCH